MKAHMVWSALFFLLAVGALSRFLQWEKGPELINKTARAYGNLFQNTIHG